MFIDDIGKLNFIDGKKRPQLSVLMPSKYSEFMLEAEDIPHESIYSYSFSQLQKMSDGDLAKLSLMKLNKEPYIIYVENISQLYEIQDNKTLPTKIANE